MKTSTKEKLASAALTFAVRLLKKKFQTPIVAKKPETLQVIYPDGRVEEIVCNPIPRKTK